MERKIGEIFGYNSEWYQTSESENCECCGFQNTKCDGIRNVRGECVRSYRSDRKPVIFKKLGKVGKSITVKGRTFQKLISDNYSCANCVFNIPNKECYKDSYIEGPCPDNEIWAEIKQNKEDMEEQKIQHYDCFFEREQPKPNLKPFDLKAAKAGKPVCTRDGRKARIICFDKKNDYYPIIALIEIEGKECIFQYTNTGEYLDGNKNTSDYNLMMLPEKKEGWVNVYKIGARLETGGNVHKTKEEAVKYLDSDKQHIAACKISWEE